MRDAASQPARARRGRPAPAAARLSGPGGRALRGGPSPEAAVLGVAAARAWGGGGGRTAPRCRDTALRRGLPARPSSLTPRLKLRPRAGGARGGARMCAPRVRPGRGPAPPPSRRPRRPRRASGPRPPRPPRPGPCPPLGARGPSSPGRAWCGAGAPRPPGRGGSARGRWAKSQPTAPDGSGGGCALRPEAESSGVRPWAEEHGRAAPRPPAPAPARVARICPRSRFGDDHAECLRGPAPSILPAT